jgi:hypothetical protein
MSDALKRAVHFRQLAKECHTAALCSSDEMRDHYLQMEEDYRVQAEAEELSASAYGD